MKSVQNILFIGIFLAIQCSHATIQPSVESMVKKSSLIVIAKALKVEHRNEKFQIIRLKIQEIICGKKPLSSSNILMLNYAASTFIGHEYINFHNLISSEKPKYFLLTIKNNRYWLVDEWFGILDANDENNLKVKKNLSHCQS